MRLRVRAGVKGQSRYADDTDGVIGAGVRDWKIEGEGWPNLKLSRAIITMALALLVLRGYEVKENGTHELFASTLFAVAFEGKIRDGCLTAGDAGNEEPS